MIVTAYDERTASCSDDVPLRVKVKVHPTVDHEGTGGHVEVFFL